MAVLNRLILHGPAENRILFSLMAIPHYGEAFDVRVKPKRLFMIGGHHHDNK